MKLNWTVAGEDLAVGDRVSIRDGLALRSTDSVDARMIRPCRVGAAVLRTDLQKPDGRRWPDEQRCGWCGRDYDDDEPMCGWVDGTAHCGHCGAIQPGEPFRVLLDIIEAAAFAMWCARGSVTVVLTRNDESVTEEPVVTGAYVIVPAGWTSHIEGGPNVRVVDERWSVAAQ